MEYTITIIAAVLVIIILPLLLARRLDKMNSLDPITKTPMESEYQRALKTPDADEWTRGMAVTPNIPMLEIGNAYPVRFRKVDGTLRDYVSFVVVFITQTKSGPMYHGIDRSTDEMRVVGFCHKQLIASWPCEMLSPVEMVEMRKLVREHNNPNNNRRVVPVCRECGQDGETVDIGPDGVCSDCNDSKQ